MHLLSSSEQYGTLFYVSMEIQGVNPIKKDQVRITGISLDLYGPGKHHLLVDVCLDVDLDNLFESRRDYTNVGPRIKTLIREHSCEGLNKLVEIITQDLLFTYLHSDAVEVTIYEQDVPVSHAQFATLKINRY
jgi:dihydroneopterin aldolase